MTLVLGCYFGHDSNFALVRDGVILRHCECERTTRVKHQGGFGAGTLRKMLGAEGLRIEDVDVVAVGGSLIRPAHDPWPEVEEALYPTVRAGESAVKGRGWWHHQEARLQGQILPTYLVHHHVSHAALALYMSPHPTAGVMSWDGGGDGANGLWVHATDGRIDRVVFDPPDGTPAVCIGGVWTVICNLFPLVRRVDYEGKVMGHAAYREAADPRLMDILTAGMWDFSRTGSWEAVSRQMVAAVRGEVGELRSMEDEGAYRLSASLQAATEGVMERLLAEMEGIAADEPLCLSGGCAYNCVANGQIAAHRGSPVFVPPAAHDGGLALGAALFVGHHLLGWPHSGMEASPYLGVGEWRATEEIVPAVVDDLVAGRLVAWFDGPSESGKRALGARSLLLDPRLRDGKERINERVKRREWFRPFAPSVLAEHQEWAARRVPDSPYMGFSCEVGAGWAEMAPAVVHVDGSVRHQTVRDGSPNRVYWEILEGFYEATGVPMVLNTSLNVQTPICDLPEEAEALFASYSGIDVLYLHGVRHAR